MNDLQKFRALQWLERALGMAYAPAYALHQASMHYSVEPGELAELLLVKRVECDRAREERDALAAADREVETGGSSMNRTERDRLITEARASGEILEEIAARFGVTRQRAQQIDVAARKRAEVQP